jgi:hypothetical protein
MSYLKIHLQFPMLIGAAMALSGIQSSQADQAKPMLRIICATSLSEKHHILIASKSDQGEWKELAKAELTSPLVSDWLPAQAGELHLAEEKDGKMNSIGHFTYPAGARRALVALSANKKEGTYTVHTFDPEKEGHVKGTLLILNLGPHKASVTLGSDKLAVEAGKHLAAKPTPDENGGYRLMVSYSGADGTEHLCYDRVAMNSSNVRNILFLLPEESVGLQVLTLSEFGPFE